MVSAEQDVSLCFHAINDACWESSPVCLQDTCLEDDDFEGMISGLSSSDSDTDARTPVDIVSTPTSLLTPDGWDAYADESQLPSADTWSSYLGEGHLQGDAAVA